MAFWNFHRSSGMLAASVALALLMPAPGQAQVTTHAALMQGAPA
jgi:hypothetical protein